MVYVLLGRSMDDLVWLRCLIDHVSAYRMLAVVAHDKVGVLGVIRKLGQIFAEVSASAVSFVVFGSFIFAFDFLLFGPQILLYGSHSFF